MARSLSERRYEYRVILPSPLGQVIVQGTKTHIQFLKFNTSVSESLSEVIQPPMLRVSNVSPNWLDDCRLQLQQYFSGQRQVFDLPIAPEGTEFQQCVWQALLKIKHGEIASYQKLAQLLARPSAVRAVASANARNPIWLLIPCHRIIGSDLALRGYAGGVIRKAQLLTIEGATFDCISLEQVSDKTKLILPAGKNHHYV